MISAENKYEEDAIKFFMMAYGVNPGSYTVVLKRKPGMNQTDGLTVPAAKDKFVVFIGDKVFGAELIRLIAHEIAHVCQIIKGDMEFTQTNGTTKVFWHGEEINPDKVAYRKRPWEIEAFTLEKKYVHEFIKKFGNQLQERLVHQDGEWVLLAKSSDRVLKKFGKTKPSDEEVAKEEKRIQYFKHHNEGLQMKTFKEYFESIQQFFGSTKTDKETDDVIKAYTDHFNKLGYTKSIQKHQSTQTYVFENGKGDTVYLETWFGKGKNGKAMLSVASFDIKERKWTTRAEWVTGTSEIRTEEGHTKEIKKAIDYLKTVKK